MIVTTLLALDTDIPVPAAILFICKLGAEPLETRDTPLPPALVKFTLVAIDRDEPRSVTFIPVPADICPIKQACLARYGEPAWARKSVSATSFQHPSGYSVLKGIP